MHDVQLSIVDYYAETARTRDLDRLATRVRAATSFIQVLNDLLTRESSISADYARLLTQPPDARLEILLAFKYVRNVMQHVLHPVRPTENALIGGLHGMRTYALWEDIPGPVHAALHSPTRALRAHFDGHLRGNEVTDTRLEAAWAFAQVSADLVHHTDGEWTGFPLPAQPGVDVRLHPDPAHPPGP